MPTMKAALAARWADSSGGTPPLYYEEAPDSAVLPYVVYLVLEHAPAISSGGNIEQSHTVQFSAYATSNAAAEAIGDAITTAFNARPTRTPLAWDGGGEIAMNPSEARTRKEEATARVPARGPGGSPVWCRMQSYTLYARGTI